MSEKLPRISGKQLLGALLALEFEVIRVRGSHHLLRHADGRTTVIPVHGKETIGPGLIGKILRDCELTREELREAL